MNLEEKRGNKREKEKKETEECTERKKYETNKEKEKKRPEEGEQKREWEE